LRRRSSIDNLKEKQHQIYESHEIKKSNEETGCGDGNLPGHGSSTSSDWETDDDLPLARMITPSKNKKPNSRLKNSLHLPAVATACDRHGVSDRSAAAIASAVLEDFGLVTHEDRSRVIDRMTIRRQRQKKRIKINENLNANILRSIFFDGRKDNTH